SVLIFTPVQAGDNVRRKASDVKAGDLILPKGRRLQPQDLGMLAMFGMRLVAVTRRPRVALISTGDELQPLDSALQPGKIYDSNNTLLSAQVEKYGGESLCFGVVPDEAAAIEAVLDRAVAGGADLIVSSAGVSVGAFDYVRHVVERNGHLQFWRVNMRPGKPLAFGVYRSVPFIGLPGNPVSAFVTFELFVRPALLKMKGIEGDERRIQSVTLVEAVESDGRESYLRAVAREEDGQWVARLTGHQGSGNLFSLVQANALLIIPAGVRALAKGSRTQAWIL
ncbi:MAG: molybdopterin molybdotransferase MoeA, partial [Anaerolineales bacterium]|nr:molybdopterin molybdotransferase MoeA [Anaerolineales bacterium]